MFDTLLEDMRPNLMVCAAACTSLSLAAGKGWHFVKDDPGTGKHIVEIDARSFQRTSEVKAFQLQDVTVRIYNRAGTSHKEMRSKQAVIDEKLGILTYGPGLQSVLKLDASK